MHADLYQCRYAAWKKEKDEAAAAAAGEGEGEGEGEEGGEEPPEGEEEPPEGEEMPDEGDEGDAPPEVRGGDCDFWCDVMCMCNVCGRT